MKAINSINKNEDIDSLFSFQNFDDDEYLLDRQKDYSYLPTVSVVVDTYSKEPEEIHISEIYERIRRGTYKKVIQEIRATTESKKRKELKLKLPAIIFGGVFKDRTNPMEISGLICLDFDHVLELDKLLFRLKLHRYVYMFFMSPSGNGVKVIIRSNVDSEEEYKETTLKLIDNFREQGYQADIVKQSLNDLCFFSYDPDIYFNPSAIIWRDLSLDHLGFTEKLNPIL